jgi:hypothetical protein
MKGKPPAPLKGRKASSTANRRGSRGRHKKEGRHFEHLNKKGKTLVSTTKRRQVIIEKEKKV